MPLVEISLSKGGLTPEQQLRLSRAVQKALVEEYKNITGKDTFSWVFCRELTGQSLLIDGMTPAEKRAKGQTP